MKLIFKTSIVGLAVASCATAISVPAMAADELNLYSYRQPFLIKPLMEAFTEETGTKVNIVFAKKGMLERIKSEGKNSPADLILTVDIGRLNDMVEAGVLAQTSSKTLQERIPPNLRDPKGQWYGLTQRGRVLYVSKARVSESADLDYESLADPMYKGRVCTRSGKHVYNVSLIASVIAHKGVEKAEQWLQGVKSNLARKPQGNDRSQAKAIFAGECDIGLGNTYYYGKMVTEKKKTEQNQWAEAIRVVFPNQKNRGTHMNISGAGVLKGSSNKAAALELIEFLSGDRAQEIYAQQNFEYPVVEGIKVDQVTARLGTFTADQIDLAEVAKFRTEASKLVDRVGFDLGPDD